MRFPYLVSLSGPQGSGKSTTLNALSELIKERNLAIFIDDFKLSRSVQERLGVADLSHAVQSFNNMHEFQEMILEARQLREDELFDMHLHGDIDIIITERSHADICAYYRLWSEKLNADSDEQIMSQTQFISDCRFESYNTSCFLYLPFMDHVKFEVDPNRAGSEDIQRFNDLLLEELELMSQDGYCTVVGITPRERAESILNQLSDYL